MTIRSEKLRTVLRFAIPFVLIPVLAVLGETVFDEKKHLFVSLAVAVLSLILFYTGFEQKKIGTRRMVIVAVMVALSGAGRFIPLFKPVAAITVITAIWLGGEAGFLVGSLSALLHDLCHACKLLLRCLACLCFKRCGTVDLVSVLPVLLYRIKCAVGALKQKGVFLSVLRCEHNS